MIRADSIPNPCLRSVEVVSAADGWKTGTTAERVQTP